MVAEHIEQLRKQIEFCEQHLAPALDAFYAAREGFAFGRVNIQQSGSVAYLSVSATVTSRDDMLDMIVALAENGIRRLKGDTPYDSPDEMIRLYDFRHGAVRLVLHVALLGENCKRIETGTRPVYEIVCD